MKWVKIYKVMLSNVYCLFALNFIDSDKEPMWIDLSLGEKYNQKIANIRRKCFVFTKIYLPRKNTVGSFEKKIL
jgi:hypothetical protein